MQQLYSLELLKNEFDNKGGLKYLFFWGHVNKHKEDIGKFCLSQWFELPFIVDGITYLTAEHWMMAKKALLFGNQSIYDKIIKVKKPAEVKELGRQVLNFDELVWNENRYDIVKQGNIHKFNQHPKFRDYLINTGERIIVEASPADIIWGIGLSQDDPQAHNPYLWRGSNLLGFALMEVRDFIR